MVVGQTRQIYSECMGKIVILMFDNSRKSGFSLPTFSLSAGFKSRINKVSLILQCMSDSLVAKMSVISFYPVACLGHMIGNGRRMAVTRQRFIEVFRFPVMQSTFCFSNVTIITIPAASLINYFRPKRAVEFVVIGEKKT